MGVVENVDYDKFPKQGRDLHCRAKVFFRYQDKTVFGTIVRDDCEEPGLIILKLDDGRYILSTECQYQPESLWI
jgi:hypothetical protein